MVEKGAWPAQGGNAGGQVGARTRVPEPDQSPPASGPPPQRASPSLGRWGNVLRTAKISELAHDELGTRPSARVSDVLCEDIGLFTRVLF